MPNTEPRRPSDRCEFQIALVCALPTESSAVAALLDGLWDDYGKNSNDNNSYTTGYIGKHNVVLVHLPSIGKIAAATAGTQLRNSFPNVRLCLVVGICGGVPKGTDRGEIHLGDVLISTGIKQFDLARHYPDGLEKKDTLDDRLGRPIPEIRAFLHKLRALNVEKETLAYARELCSAERYPKWKRPDSLADQLFAPAYRHKHQNPDDCAICSGCENFEDTVCPQARESSCSDLGCNQLVSRKCPARCLNGYDDSEPLIHFGWFASGDTVMKSGLHRDSIASQHGIIGFEMEGAGLWECVPTIIIKSVCDYADSHKNKAWQAYAAATAASCMKAIVNQWSFNYDLVQQLPISESVQRISDQQECLKSLAFPEMFARQNKTREAAPGTFTWLPNHPSYQIWNSQQRGLLWIKGKPDSGKSTLVNHAIEQQKQLQRNEILISFFCDGSGNSLQRSPIGLFRSLLHQILSRVPHLADQFASNFREKRETRGDPGKDWNWELGELQYFLKNTVMSSSKTPSIRVFVDAVDECGEENAVCIASFFEELCSSCNPNLNNPTICFSCRHYPNIRIYQDDDLIITLENENGDDIEQYVKRMLEPAFPKNEAGLVIFQILRHANGIFQWASLVTDVVRKLRRQKRNVEFILQQIRETPTDLHTLYHKIFQATAPDDRPKTLKLMQWLCFARRPLSLMEIYIPLSLDKDSVIGSIERCLQSAGVSNLEELEEEIKRLSGGLVEFQEIGTDKFVRFIHQSVFDYLVKTGLQRLSHSPETIYDAQFQLSRSCLKYLTMTEFLSFPRVRKYDVTSDEISLAFKSAGIVLDEPWTPQQDQRFAFYLYAHDNWIHHVQQVEQTGFRQDDILELLRWPDHGIFRSWVSFNNAVTNLTGAIYDFSDSFLGSLLHVASQHGLLSVIEAICDGPQNYREGMVMLPASAFDSAVRNNHPGVVKALLNSGLFDVNSPGRWKETPLAIAADLGHLQVVKVLLSTSQIRINARDRRGATSLLRASRKGHVDIVRELMKFPRIDINIADSEGCTPLAGAVQYSHETVVQLLLGTTDIHIDSKDKDGRSPLFFAARNPNEDICRQLLVRKADVNARAQNSRTPLFDACRFDNPKVIELLIEAGAEVNARDKDGRTPLFHTHQSHNPKVLQLLAEAGADVNVRDKDGRTPLFNACYTGKPKIIDFFIKAGADVNARAADGRRPLFEACSHFTSLQVVELLLEAGADVNARAQNGHIALFDACRGGNPKLIELLIEAGAEVNAREEDGGTPLFTTCHFYNLKAVQLLIEAGAEVNARARHDRTPLFAACSSGILKVAELLIKAGAEVNARDQDGRTPLFIACHIRNPKLAQLLLEAGGEVKARDKDGQTPLFIACTSRNLKAAELLVKAGADVNARLQNGRTPLFDACSVGGNLNIVTLLLEASAEVDVSDLDGITPLFLALRHENFGIAKLLLTRDDPMAQTIGMVENTILYTINNVRPRELRWLWESGLVHSDIITKYSVSVDEFFIKMYQAGVIWR